MIGVEFGPRRFELVPSRIYASQIFDILTLVELAPMRPGAQPHHEVFEGIEDAELDRVVDEPEGVEKHRVAAAVRSEIGLLRSFEKLHFHNPPWVSFGEI